jgi:hypothetical protein
MKKNCPCPFINTGGAVVVAVMSICPADQVTATPADPDTARLLGWSHLGSGVTSETGMVRVGQLTFPRATGPQVRGIVQVFYRPEDVLVSTQLGAAAGTGTVSVTTTIAEIVPTRPLARISLASDPPLTALVLHRDLGPLCARPGDPVTATLPEDSVRIFPSA